MMADFRRRRNSGAALDGDDGGLPAKEKQRRCSSMARTTDAGSGGDDRQNDEGLKQSRRLARGEIELRVGNGAPVAALAIGTYSLVLPSGLMLELNDCLYVPAISRNIISVSCLDKSGFIISIKDKSLSVYRKNVLYANANMTNGLYVLDLDMPVYNISAKRNKPNGVWLKNFITELGVVPSIKNPIPLFCDNNGAIAQAKEPRSHQKTKHIVRRYHIIREIVARGDVEICKIGTDDNIADPFTKALGKPKHESHTWSMGIREKLDWP
ncbi:unnamed protein product [Cuscuta campestris]|uniref:Retrovirus-related Pol polyprotein from transposon TNT 1-94-like beta-barrel domain-containing protein n=1 Tax=Cuscuta campestris TaxID=132261 RepID=A0A484LIW1_9ASTE|nr:unnamed protein product [Cuscuta campestris]